MMDDAARLDQLAQQLEQDGDDMRAIRCMERAVAMRGEGSTPDVAAGVERLIIKYNTVAVRSFKSDDYETATALLANAQNLTDADRPYFEHNVQQRMRLRGTTFNNLGCMERRRGRLDLAAKYLRLSLELDGNQSAVTYLNLGAIYTQMRRPEEAVACSRRAIGLLNAQLATGDANNGGGSGGNPGLVAVAHHNLAMALEGLDRGACLSAYETALQVARSQLGHASPTTVSIQRNYDRYASTPPPPRGTTTGSNANAHGGATAGTGARGGAPQPMPQSFLPPLQVPRAAATTPRGPSKSSRRQDALGAVTPGGAQQPRGHSTTRPSPRRNGSPGDERGAGGGQRQRMISTAPATARPAPPRADRAKPPSGTGRRHERASGGGGKSDRTPVKAFAPREQSDSDAISDSDRDDGASPFGRRPSGANPQQSKAGQRPSPAPGKTPRPPLAGGGSRTGGAGGDNTDTLGRANTMSEAASSRAPATIRQLDHEEEKRKDDVVAFMVSRLGALLRGEEEFELRYAAAVKVQCLARGVAARQAAEKRRVMRRQALAAQELRERGAAAKLIEFFKTLVERRHQSLKAADEARAEGVRRDRAAVKIQSVARRWLAKQLVKRLRAYYRDYTRALRRLQCWFRVGLAKATVHKMRLVAQDATRKKLAAERLNFAAVQIQRSFRAFRALRTTSLRKSTLRAARERDRESNRTHSAKRLQAFWRRIRAGDFTDAIRAEREDLARRRERIELRVDAATRLQAWVRGWLARRQAVDVVAAVRATRARLLEARRQRAALRLQCLARRVAAKQRVDALRRERRFARVVARHLYAAPIVAAFVQALPALLDFAARLDARFAPPPPPPPPPPAPVPRTPSPVEEQAPLPTEEPVAPAPEPSVAPSSSEVEVAEAPAAPVGAARTDAHAIESTPLRSNTSSAAADAAGADEAITSSIPTGEAPLPAVRADDIPFAEIAEAATPAAVPADDDDRPRTPPLLEGPDSLPDEEPYVVPPRVPTPAKLKLSVAYLEEKRKRELAERQRRRLAEIDPEAHKSVHERQSETLAREQLRASQAAAAAQAARRDAAARKLQGFCRGVVDRVLFRDKLALLGEYVDALVAAHRQGGVMVPRPPPAAATTAAAATLRAVPPSQPKSSTSASAGSTSNGRSHTGRRAASLTSAAAALPAGESGLSFIDLAERRLGTQIEAHRRVMAATRVQAALRTRAAMHERERRRGRQGLVETAAVTVTRFGRRVASRSRSSERRAAAARVSDERVARENALDAARAAAAPVVAAAMHARASIAECAVRADAARGRANAASVVLAGFSRIVFAKRRRAERSLRLRRAVEQRVEDESVLPTPPAEDDAPVASAAAPAATEAAIAAVEPITADKDESAIPPAEAAETAAVAGNVSSLQEEVAGSSPAADAEPAVPTVPPHVAARKIVCAARQCLARRAVAARRAAANAERLDAIAREEAAEEASPAQQAESSAPAPEEVVVEPAAAVEAAPASADSQPICPSAVVDTNAAAVRIQCAVRQRQARASAAEKRSERSDRWAARQAALEAEDAAHADVFATPARGSGEPSETVSPTTATETAINENTDVAANAPNTQPPPAASDASADAATAAISSDKAASVIQRSFRGHAARQEADRRRASARAKWDERAQRIAEEEADLSF